MEKRERKTWDDREGKAKRDEEGTERRREGEKLHGRASVEVRGFQTTCGSNKLQK